MDASQPAPAAPERQPLNFVVQVANIHVLEGILDIAAVRADEVRRDFQLQNRIEEFPVFTADGNHPPDRRRYGCG